MIPKIGTQFREGGEEGLRRRWEKSLGCARLIRAPRAGNFRQYGFSGLAHFWRMFRPTTFDRARERAQVPEGRGASC